MNALLTLAALKAFTKLSAGRCTSNKCLIGKTAIITGCTSGLGYETAKQLASRGCRLYLNGLINLNEDIISLLRYAFNNEHVYYHHMNLESLESVRRFCDFYKTREKGLDLLIHNAERMGAPRVITPDNTLAVMQVNHLTPFLMNHLLQDQLKAVPGSRIVYTGNLVGYMGTLGRSFGAQSVNAEGKLVNLLDFANSKCCQMISTRMFAQKLRPHKITCNVAFPGWVDIEARKIHNNIEAGNMFFDVCKIFLDGWIHMYGKNRLEGAQMNLHTALSAELDDTTGKFIMDNRVFPLPYYTRNKDFCESFWELSESLCQLSSVEKLAPKL